MSPRVEVVVYFLNGKPARRLSVPLPASAHTVRHLIEQHHIIEDDKDDIWPILVPEAPCRTFVIGRGQFMDAMMSINDDWDYHAHMRDRAFAKEIADIRREFNERFRMLEQANSDRSARLIKTDRDLVLFSAISYIEALAAGSVAPTGEPRPNERRRRNPTQDHETKRRLLDLLARPNSFIASRLRSPAGRNVLTAENASRLCQSASMDERNIRAHLENTPAALITSLLVLEKSAHRVWGGATIETMALHMIMLMLGPSGFVAILTEIESDRGLTYEPLDDEQVRRLFMTQGSVVYL